MQTDKSEFQIIRLQQQHTPLFQQLVALFHDVFEMDTAISSTEERLHKMLGNPGFIVFTALNNNEVIGGLTAYQLPSYYT